MRSQSSQSATAESSARPQETASRKLSLAEMAKECGIPEAITPHFTAMQTVLQSILAAATPAP